VHRGRLTGVGLLTALMVGLAFGADRPVISVSGGGLTPDRIEVHVGEIIRWRAVSGVRIRLEFDPHRDAHEVIERDEEIRAVFTRAGEHRYIASIIGDGHRHARGWSW
jgi:plastocyanin